jgi:hypothetical protein
LVLLAVGICEAVGVDPGTLALVGWAMAMQFWFLPVYLLVSALTPVLHAAHRRWGLAVPVAMGAVAVIADTLVLTVHAPLVGLLNHILVWGVAYQLGFCWRDGLLTGLRLPGAMAVGGGLVFAALVGPGPFPVSLILVTGQTPSNTNPPSVAMLAWAVAQVGACLLAAPALRRLLERERVWRIVRPLGGVSMTLYLWHMLPVLIAAAAFYLTGLAPEPALDSASWWALRLPWLLVLGAVLTVVVSALRPFEGALTARYERVRPDTGPYRAWLLWPGLAVTVLALIRFATRGFAEDGRVPVPAAAGLVLGTALVLLHRAPGGHGSVPRRPAGAEGALEEAA